MRMQRREFLKSAVALAAVSGLPASREAAAASARGYPYLGRTEDYAEFRIIDPGLRITKVESWTQGQHGIVRVTTNDGHEGYGQLSSFEPDITATVLHRQVARHVVGSDPARIDALGGSYEESVSMLKKALAIDPNMIVANYQLAKTYRQMDRGPEEKVLLQKVLILPIRDFRDKFAKEKANKRLNGISK